MTNRNLIIPSTVATDLVRRLEVHQHQARGAMSANTERALKADIVIFTGWCTDRGLDCLPASPDTVAAFVDHMAETRKPATVRRYVSSVATFHRQADLDTPTSTETVKLALRRMARSNGTRQDQVAPATRDVVDKLIAAAGNRIIDLRNVAMLTVAYDTLVRRSELVELKVVDYQVAEDGSASVLVRRGKTDQAGEGSVRYLAPDTVARVRGWLDQANVTDGAMFRSVSRSGLAGGPLQAGEVARIFKRMATTAGLDPVGLSGHSTRVGAAQDQVAAGLDVAEVMQAGGWRTPVMVARYSERLGARRGGAAKLARSQGRA